jgi:hypothetical protein
VLQEERDSVVDGCLLDDVVVVEGQHCRPVHLVEVVDEADEDRVGRTFSARLHQCRRVRERVRVPFAQCGDQMGQESAGVVVPPVQ